MDSDRWCAPELEADRQWHEPEVIIYNNSVFPGVSCTASAYDVANRRWYELNVDSVVRDEDDWMSEVITKHITDYHSKHGILPDFNVINTTRQGFPTTFEKKPNEHVARRIQGNFRYGRRGSDVLPTTTFDQVKEKIHLSCSTDRCVWNGLDCAFKRIEFVEDLEVMEREIRMREKLLHALREDPGAGTSIQERFHILPILAVVHKHDKTDEILGILLPYGGTSLETLAGGYKYGMGYRDDDGEEDQDEAHEESHCRSSRAVMQPTLLFSSPITESHFQGLVMSVWELARAGVLHGDINDRNTLLTPDNHLVLVDLGEVAPDYKGDAHALGSMMLWAAERADWDATVVERVKKIGTCLQRVFDI
ncbi:hypothetical protein ACJ41O_012036 [Fusarium nematophilum]